MSEEMKKLKLFLQIFFMSISYGCEQAKQLYQLKRKLQSGEILGDIVQRPKKKKK